jgi:Fe-S-cluster containining protein
VTRLRPHRRRLEVVRARVAAEVAPLVENAPEGAALAAYRLSDEEKVRSDEHSLGPLLACAAGCSFCCHVHVETTAPELLAIAGFVRRTLAPHALTSLRERLTQRVAVAGTLSDEARWAARVPCALLDEQGRCSVYPVRPLRCRAFHSCSAAACRAAFDGTSDDEPLVNPTLARALGAVEAGYDDALVSAGGSAAGVRLESGLLALLSAT